MSPRVTITESPLSPSIVIHCNVREIPIERLDEVKEAQKLFLKFCAASSAFKNK
jgi:hypothetical protein